MNIFDLLFPRRCATCGKLGKYICDKCYQKIEFIKFQICPYCAGCSIGGFTHPKCRRVYGLDGMYAIAHYKGPIKDLVHLVKYRLVSDAVETLGGLLMSHLPKSLPEFDFLVPVALHKRRERERGFNQSLLLGKIISEKLHVPILDGVLKRIRYTKPQVDLKGEERRNNLEDVFACEAVSEISGKSIALIDDVSTTRTTLIECAKALKRKGARIVWGLVLAHG